MSKKRTFTVLFTYSAQGEIEVEAASMEDAETEAEILLDEIRNLGEMSTDPRIAWSGDEVEI